jgi:hypothetical protein
MLSSVMGCVSHPPYKRQTSALAAIKLLLTQDRLPTVVTKVGCHATGCSGIGAQLIQPSFLPLLIVKP